MKKAGKLIGHSDKARGLSHIQANTIPQEQRNLFLALDLYLDCGLACSLHGPQALARGSLSRSLAHLVMHSLVCLHALQPRLCDFAAGAATWPLSRPAPRATSRRQPDTDSRQEQAKLPG